MSVHPTEHVIAKKLASAGRVRIHTFQRHRYREDTFAAMTDCGLTPDWRFRSLLWVELRTLDPGRVVFCRHCVKEDS